MALPYESVLPAHSWILVTGVNGFLGSNIANQFLHYGFRVRGTVRDINRNAWLRDLFEERYGVGSFELVQIEQLALPKAFDECLTNVHGVVHAASDVSLCDDPHVVVTAAVESGLNVIKAAAKHPTVKRFVYLSSTVAAVTVELEIAMTIENDQFNGLAKQKAWDPPPYDGRGPHVYAASKTQTEEALWEFVRRENPLFTFNTVLPDVVFGPSLNPQIQGFPSTSGWVVEFFKGNEAFMRQIVDLIPPQYFIDVEDTARLHVLAMTHPEVANERLFGVAELFDFNLLLDLFRKLYPERNFRTAFPAKPENLTIFSGKPRADTLMHRLLGRGFLTLEESVAATLQQVVT